MFLYKTVNQRVCVLARNDAPRDVAVMFSACECVCVCRSDSLAHRRPSERCITRNGLPTASASLPELKRVSGPRSSSRPVKTSSMSPEDGRKGSRETRDAASRSIIRRRGAWIPCVSFRTCSCSSCVRSTYVRSDSSSGCALPAESSDLANLASERQRQRVSRRRLQRQQHHHSPMHQERALRVHRDTVASRRLLSSGR